MSEEVGKSVCYTMLFSSLIGIGLGIFHLARETTHPFSRALDTARAQSHLMRNNGILPEWAEGRNDLGLDRV